MKSFKVIFWHDNKSNIIWRGFYSKTHSVHFLAKLSKNFVHMLIVSIGIITHPPTHTHPTHTHPTTTHPSPHPVTSTQASLIHPQTHWHSPPSTPPYPHPHTHKIATLKTSVFFFQKLTQSNSLCPWIWIGTNLNWVSFVKTNRFSRYPFCTTIRLYLFFFWCINSHFVSV